MCFSHCVIISQVFISFKYIQELARKDRKLILDHAQM